MDVEVAYSKIARFHKPLISQLVDEDGADEELAAFALLLPAAPVLLPQQIRSKENDSYVVRHHNFTVFFSFIYGTQTALIKKDFR